MRILTIIALLLSITICNSQNLNLVPVDSANFEFVSDSLVDYSNLTNFKFDPEVYKKCPCIIDSLNGFVSFKSKSNLIANNKCMFIYKIDTSYFTRIGQMINRKDEHREYIWTFSTKKIKEKEAKEYIELVKNEIYKATVPRLASTVIVYDGTTYIFGDLEKSSFAITPVSYYSNSVGKLIKSTEKLAKKYK
jgi:hypothetical protein